MSREGNGNTRRKGDLYGGAWLPRALTIVEGEDGRSIIPEIRAERARSD